MLRENFFGELRIAKSLIRVLNKLNDEKLNKHISILLNKYISKLNSVEEITNKTNREHFRKMLLKEYLELLKAKNYNYDVNRYLEGLIRTKYKILNKLNFKAPIKREEDDDDIFDIHPIFPRQTETY